MLTQVYSSPPTEIISDVYSPTFKRMLKCRWDTGAPKTYFKLTPFFTKASNGLSMLETKHGIVQANKYDIILQPDPTGKSVEVEALGITKLKDVDCVIGMDVIGRGDFTIVMNKGSIYFRFIF